MKARLINLSTAYKVVSNSGSYGDYLWLQHLWIELTKENDFDCIIFSLSNVNFFGWQLSQHTLDCLKLLKETKKPVICLFLDFKCYTKKLKNRPAYPNLEDLQFEDYKDNWFLLHYCREGDKLKTYIDNIKNWIKIKPDNIRYLNNMSFWYNDLIKIKEPIKKVCYVWNGRGWDRSKFLNKFEDIDIYGRWKDKQKVELQQHNFNWVIKQTEVQNTLNDYFAQLITYDDIGINYKVDVTRLVYTVAAWSLPIIDVRLKYLDLPEEFDNLFIENQEQLNKLLNISEEERKNIILQLQKYFTKTLNKEKELNKFISIIKDYENQL